MSTYTIWVWDDYGRTQLIEEHDSLDDAVSETKRFRPEWREIRIYEHRGKKRILVHRELREGVAVCIKREREAGYSLVQVSNFCGVPLSTVNEILKKG